MQCPVDGTALAMSDRQGIEIDYCPQCRGVWLDRGELDKIIERGDQESRGSSRPQHEANYYPERRDDHQPRYEDRRDDHRSYDHDDDDYRRHDSHHGDHGHHKKKKESFLGDMFDF